MVGDMRRYAASLAAVVALAGVGVGVAGCTTSGPGAQGSPPASAGPTSPGASSAGGASGPATSTVTAGATTTLAYPADVPAEARVDSPAGAMAFARYFFAQVNKAYTTPQAGLIAPISTANCKSCAGYEQRATELVEKRQRFDRPPMVELEIGLAPETEDGAILVDFVFRQAEARLLDSSGTEISKFTGKRGIFLLHARWVSGAWMADRIQVRQP